MIYLYQIIFSLIIIALILFIIIKYNRYEKFINSNNEDINENSIILNLENNLKNLKPSKENSVTHHSKNELVIGCYNYKEPKLLTNKGGIKIFIESLRKFNKTCTIIVLMNTCPPEIKDLFNKNNVNCLLGFKENLMYTRFIKYLKIINRIKSFNKILLCDLNDVIFQGNPFDIKLDNNKLYCAQEISSYDDLSDSSTLLNLHWIRDAHKFNIGLKNIYKKKYKNKNVICAGTILGNRDAILSYLIWYEKIQTKAVKLRNDQGLLNIYAYEYGDNRVIVERYQDGKILTLDKINFENIRKDSNGFLINSKGEKYCIIHQIDRCGQDNLKYLKDTILG